MSNNKEQERARQSALKSPGEKRAKTGEEVGMDGVLDETQAAGKVPPGLQVLLLVSFLLFLGQGLLLRLLRLGEMDNMHVDML